MTATSPCPSAPSGCGCAGSRPGPGRVPCLPVASGNGAFPAAGGQELHAVHGNRGQVRQFRLREGGRLDLPGRRSQDAPEACSARWCSSGCPARGRPRSAGSWRRRPGQGVRHRGRPALLDLGFGELGFHRIDAKLDALNTASAGSANGWACGWRPRRWKMALQGRVVHGADLRHARRTNGRPLSGPAGGLPGRIDLTQMAGMKSSFRPSPSDQGRTGPA